MPTGAGAPPPPGASKAQGNATEMQRKCEEMQGNAGVSKAFPSRFEDFSSSKVLSFSSSAAASATAAFRGSHERADSQATLTVVSPKLKTRAELISFLHSFHLFSSLLFISSLFSMSFHLFSFLFNVFSMCFHRFRCQSRREARRRSLRRPFCAPGLGRAQVLRVLYDLQLGHFCPRKWNSTWDGC